MAVTSSPGDAAPQAEHGVHASRLAAGLVVVLVAGAALVGWHGATRSTPAVGYDAQALLAYAEILDAEGRFPTEEESYEFATPPAFPWLAVQLQTVVDRTGEGAADLVSGASGAGARLAWLAAVAVAVVLVLRFRRGHPAWVAGLVLAGLSALAALARVDATAFETRWTAGQSLSIAWMCAFIGIAWLLAREVWPARPLLAALAALVTAAIPVVLRLGVMFHPEMQFAFLAALAVLLVVRAERRGWPLRHGAAAGATLGLAALTRPTAAAVIGGLGLAALVAGRRKALPCLAVGTGVLLLVAGPWWARQIDRYGNPLKSNLDRYILEGGQPRSFYISAPVKDLVIHPFRPVFAGELWPQFHADLWSDWFGGEHNYWQEPPGRATRVFLSSQSVLGFLVSLLAIGGLFAFGGAALARVVRGRAQGCRDFLFLAALLLAVPTWIAFVVQLVRFPQAGGDPIKSSYLLFLTPVFAISALAAASWVWHQALGWRIALGALTALYAVSYTGFLVTSFPAIPR